MNLYAFICTPHDWLYSQIPIQRTFYIPVVLQWLSHTSRGQSFWWPPSCRSSDSVQPVQQPWPHYLHACGHNTYMYIHVHFMEVYVHALIRPILHILTTIWPGACTYLYCMALTNHIKKFIVFLVVGPLVGLGLGLCRTPRRSYYVRHSYL